ncbi:hypothetical protein EUX98_g9133 [Antrodiella citrinella]|uniref:DUF6532 domain-containing protein n=1 Tax=Antrodiella citrinella TaxID=2447956 RepID=A0A4S4LY86_9APHY|nr:hypothetical protein EUX98_g9133 [Antrodiella citrinella]
MPAPACMTTRKTNGVTPMPTEKIRLLAAEQLAKAKKLAKEQDLEKKKKLRQQEAQEALDAEVEYQAAIKKAARKKALAQAVAGFNAEELMEIDDDPEADELDEEDKEEMVLSKKCKAIIGSDDEDGEESDRPAPAKVRRVTAAGLAHGGVPTINVSQPKIIVSKLPAHKNKPTAAVPSTPTKRVLLDADGNPESWVEPPAQSVPGAHETVKMRMKDRTPTSRAVFRKANTIFRVCLATRDGFPTPVQIEQQTKASYAQACEELGPEFSGYKVRNGEDVVRGLIGQRCSQMRGELRTKARNLVASFYDIDACALSVDEIKNLVSALTDKSAFTFSNPMRREGLFAHPIIPELIASQWFTGQRGSPEGLAYNAAFNPVPAPLIALVSTAVCCGLKDWETGSRCESKDNAFEGSVYDKVYRTQLRRLESWQSRSPAFYDGFCKQLYDKCWKLSGKKAASNSDSEDDEMDEMDFEAEAARAGLSTEVTAAT